MTCLRALVATALLTLLSGAAMAAYIPGDRDWNVTLCKPTSPDWQVEHFYRVTFSRQAPASITFNGVTPQLSRFDTETQPASQACHAPITIRAFGINATSEGQAVIFGFSACRTVNGSEQCSGVPDWPGGGTFPAHFVQPINARFHATALADITTQGTHDVDVIVRSSNLDQPVALNVEVTATCTLQNLISVTLPASSVSAAQGRARFSINASRLFVPYAGGTPLATCTFRIPGYPAQSLVQRVRGADVTPTVTLSPHFDWVANPQTVAVQLSDSVTPARPLDFTGVRVTANCIGSAPALTGTPSGNPCSGNNPGCAWTPVAAGGSAGFSIAATGTLLPWPPGTPPELRCYFRGSRGDTVPSNPSQDPSGGFALLNPCSVPSIQPKPPGCGNP